MNEYNTLYPNIYRNYDQHQLERVLESWERMFADVSDCETFIDALYHHNRTSDYPTPPTTKVWLENYRILKEKKRADTERRIETPEEVMYQLYLEEMQKPADKRNEWLCRQALPDAKLFNDEQAYIKYFGKPRKEFEKL